MRGLSMVRDADVDCFKYSRTGWKMKPGAGTRRHGLLTVLAIAAAIAAGCSQPRPVREDPPERGFVDRTVFDRPGYESFRRRMDTVAIQEPLAELFGRTWGGDQVLVFFGAWCSDSRREVPPFLKIMDRAGVQAGAVRLYALDRTKTSDDGLTAQYHIESVPTFILLRGSQELGRIVEKPSTTLEGDLLAIVSGSR
jgi:hypothetical protein